MSRVSGCLWLGIALALALVAGGVAFVTIQRATASSAQAEGPVATAEVVVAAHPMAVGTLLHERDLTMQTIPVAALPAGALTDVASVSGQLTTVPLDAGEMILAHHLTQPDVTSSNVSFTLPEGLLAVTLSADDLLSEIGVIEPGDRVDILYSLELQPVGDGAGGEAYQYTFGTLQNVTVVSVIRSVLKENVSAGGDAGPVPSGPARAYMLALDPQDALVLKYLEDAGAMMDLALRNRADESEHITQAVDAKYLIDKFQLPVP